jgi:hypothetical protein
MPSGQPILDRMDIWSLPLGVLTDLAKWLYTRLKKPDPKLVLKRRQELKNEFQRKLPPRNTSGVHCEAIIRDLGRMDSYPDTDTGDKGISPWFKVEIKGLYHRGVEAFISSPRYVLQDEDGRWEFTKYEDDPRKVVAYPVGRIPFDLIEYVDWEGDEYYPYPHIYCRFKGPRGSPYEEIPFFAKYSDSNVLIEVEGFRPWDRYKRKGFWFLRRP